MSLISFRAEDRVSYGIAHDDGVFDLGTRIGSVLPDLASFLGAAGRGDLGFVPKPSIVDYRSGEFVYLPVIPNPAKILCVGLNYQGHRKETGRAETAHPAIFTRFADSLIAQNEAIILPPNSSSLDFEGELAVVIGKAGFRVSEEDALDLVGGYSIFNDATMRDWQHHTHQFIPGKNFPGTGAFGPSLLTPEEAGALEEKRIETRVNGKVEQEAVLGDMIFSVAAVIAYVSGFTALKPGDVIAMGTPGGVGFKRNPPVFLKEGDRVEVSIAGLGTLTNVVASEARPQ
jgi:2-keto-4-pentenoate hydratase/2-oxohepta-3-ene-1,7-dioic acid hydratase in catechol pathway